jgi:pectinesterase
MKTFIFISFLFFTNVTLAQSTAGITGIADTGYNVQSEYRKNIKNFPGIRIAQETNSTEVRVEKSITYCNAGSRTLALDVFKPADQSVKKRKAIIIIHGGGWRSGNRTLHHALAQKLALKGYVCITPEYRLSTEALYPAAVYDLKAAIRWVRKNAGSYHIDTNSIVVSGHSAGGELAAFMGATNGKAEFEGGSCNAGVSSRANAVIDMDGILAFIHPESGEGDDSKRISAATYWFGFSRSENPELWRQGSPLTHVGEHSAPVLFMNSSVDRMHAGQNDFIKRLDRYNIYAEVKTFKGAPHSFLLFHPWFDTTVAYIDDFVRVALPDVSNNSRMIPRLPMQEFPADGFFGITGGTYYAKPDEWRYWSDLIPKNV